MDLEEAGGKFGEVNWNQTRTAFTARCPSCKDHDVKVTLLAGSAFARCTNGCDAKTLKSWLSGAGEKETASAPTAASTNGHHPDPALWKLRVYKVIANVLQADSEKGKGMLGSMEEADLVEAARADAMKGLAAGLFNPLPELSEAEIGEEVESACRGAVRDFLGPKKAVPVVNGNGNGLVKVVPALPEVFVRNTIEVLTWDQLRTKRQSHVQNWAVEGWLSLGEISLWSGKVEHGKTTVMRELTLCKVRGEPFLGRPCTKGRVFYAMLDADGENLTYDEFEKMGMNDSDRENIRFLFEPMLARMERGPEQFFAELWEWKPEIVIIDPFARLKEIGDFNDYNNTYLMAMLSQYAKTLNAHFALPGHIPRGRPQGSAAATAAFGSIAFGGGANARFVIERKEGTDVHVLRTSKGKSAGFEAIEGDHVLERDPTTGRISLGKAFSFGHQAAAIKTRVLEFINNAGLQDWTPFALAKELGAAAGLVRAALGMLFDDRLIERVGAGKKGNPYVFTKRLDDCEIPAVGTIPAVELRDKRLFD